VLLNFLKTSLSGTIISSKAGNTDQFPHGRSTSIGNRRKITSSQSGILSGTEQDIAKLLSFPANTGLYETRQNYAIIKLDLIEFEILSFYYSII